MPLAKGQYPKVLPTENLTYVYPQPVAPEQPVRIFWVLGVSLLGGFYIEFNAVCISHIVPKSPKRCRGKP